MNTRYFATVLIVFVVGCGPTHTAATRGMAAKDLAVLSIAQLPDEAHVQIHAVQFDGAGDKYEIGKNRDFYLLPGAHTATFTLVAHIPGLAGIFMPSTSLTLPDLKDVPLGTMSAGKGYELAPSIESFDKLMKDGQLSLVREKVK